MVHKLWWAGFDSAIELVLKTVRKVDMHMLPIMLEDEIIDVMNYSRQLIVWREFRASTS